METTAGHYRRRWRLSGRGVETMLKTYSLGSGDDVGEVAVRDWRRCSRLCGRGVERTLET